MVNTSKRMGAISHRRAYPRSARLRTASPVGGVSIGKRAVENHIETLRNSKTSKKKQWKMLVKSENHTKSVEKTSISLEGFKLQITSPPKAPIFLLVNTLNIILPRKRTQKTGGAGY